MYENDQFCPADILIKQQLDGNITGIKKILGLGVSKALVKPYVVTHTKNAIDPTSVDLFKFKISSVQFIHIIYMEEAIFHFKISVCQCQIFANACWLTETLKNTF